MEVGKPRSTADIIKDIKSTLETKVKDYKWLEPVRAAP